MGQDLIKYEYYNGDTFYYLEEVRVGREKLSGKTFYKTRGTPVTQVQQNNVAQPLYTRASTETNIPHSGKKSSDNLKFSRKRLYQQINPIVRDGKVRQEYADLLERKGYTPETIEQWDRKAIAWIEKQGGIFPAAQKLLRDQAPTDGAVAELVRRHVLNSDVFETAFDRKERTTLYEQEIAVRSQWGKTGRAMQINALKLDDIASVQALFNKLHEGVPEPELRKGQSDILKSTNIDIFALPADILNNKSKLDEILRSEMAHKATWTSKLYEYWINAILSGPGTHLGNIFGNTGNAAYELGLKRFAEALVNTVAHRKDGATFGEFKYMLKAVNLGAAKHAFMQAFDQELLDVNNKFLENNLTAIGGKPGRFIRIPGRALRAADAFAKAIITPMETAAYAYRMGLQEGIADTAMVEYIQKQMADPDSDASLFGLSRAKELTFQEDPGTAVKYLMAMREAPGPLGAVLKTFLPFIKTPANILKQGIRKSPLGVVNLAWETGKAVMKKRDFDSDLVARAAEQLLAWGSFALLYGLSGDDDELPFITGSSAAYGSAEYAFKANKVPPYSIRIGGNYYSYAKIEPLATGLALMADAIAGFKAAKNGKTGQNILSRLLESSKKIIVEKSYLDSIGEINKIAEDPERHATRYFSNLAASAVPNIATQVLKSFDENVPDNKNREIGEDFWKEQFFVVTNQAGLTTALPKIDYFGREVKKDAWGDSLFSALARLQPIRKIKADGNMDNAEKLIWNYNQQGAETPYYPSIPRNTFNINGKKMYFAGEDYKEYAVLAGELAHRQINNAIRAGRLNVNNPTERDIKLIKQVFTKSRKIIQMRMVQQRKAKEY